MKEEVLKIINSIRPYLQADGGDVELVDVDEKTGVVKVKLIGVCGGCPMSMITLKTTIEAKIKQQLPQVKEVQAV